MLIRHDQYILWLYGASICAGACVEEEIVPVRDEFTSGDGDERFGDATCGAATWDMSIDTFDEMTTETQHSV